MVVIRTHQYDTYHPFLPLIPQTPTASLPLVRCCAVCGPDETLDKPLSKCSRCNAVSYCGRDHQKEHADAHKKVCRHIQRCREKRDALASRIPEMFDEHVGRFWRVVETRPYMHAKRDYMLALNVAMTFDGVTLALEESLDCLRLNRGDSLGIREVVPALMLMLGQFQEAYDLVKWWAIDAADRHYDFMDLNAPYMSTRGADMTEEMPKVFEDTCMFHAAVLAYIKIRLSVDYKIAVEVNDVEEAKRRGVLPSVLSAMRTKPLSGLKGTLEKLKDQVWEVTLMVNCMNPFYWQHFQDPHSLSDAISPGTCQPGTIYSPGDKFEVQNWLVPHGLLWSYTKDPAMKEPTVEYWDDFTLVFVLQYDTYHPFLPLIPFTPRPLLPLARGCVVCGVNGKPLSKCSRCLAVSYCGRDHQLEHFKSHKKVCRHIQQCREKRDALAAQIPQLFEKHVGRFWDVVETRPYMHAKRDYMLALTTSMAYDGVTLAMEEGLDYLRLNRADNLMIRDAVPAIMLMLGKLQEAYDFIKWWAVCADRDYNFADLTAPYLSIHGADMTEEIPDRTAESSVFHVAALAYIKFRLSLDYNAAMEVGNVAFLQRRGVDPSVVSALRTKSPAQLKEALARIRPHISETVEAVNIINPFYWPHILDPHSLSDAVSAGTCKRGNMRSRGDKFEVQNWLIPHGLLWSCAKDPSVKMFITSCLREFAADT